MTWRVGRTYHLHNFCPPEMNMDICLLILHYAQKLAKALHQIKKGHNQPQAQLATEKMNEHTSHHLCMALKTSMSSAFTPDTTSFHCCILKGVNMHGDLTQGIVVNHLWSVCAPVMIGLGARLRLGVG
jgi:hypothetical protein